MEIAKETNKTGNSVDKEMTERSEKGEDGTSLKRQIYEMEKALADLKASSPSNDIKTDTMRDPLVDLPTELVTKIFMCLRPLPMADGDNHMDSPFDPEKVGEVAESMKNLLLLGAVCRAWRSLAWSLPHLWTTISVNVYNENKNVPNLIRQWLQRSDELPLSIYLHIAQKVLDDGQLSPHPYGNEPYIPRLMHMINACSERWFYLNLALPKRFMQRIRCNDLGAPMLQTLTLRMIVDGIRDGAFSHSRPIDIGEMDSLKKVNLHSLTTIGVEISWTNVKEVYTELSPCPIELCCYFLDSAPELTHLTIDNLMLPYTRPVLRHQNLTTLQINPGLISDDGPDELLALLALPALEDLGIYANQQSNLDTVANLLQRSSCALKTFRLNIRDAWMGHKQQLIVLLEKMPDLELLEIECRYNWSGSDESPPISQLPTPAVIAEMKSANERIFLPNLAKVHIHLEHNDWSCTLGLRMQPDNEDAASSSGSEDDHAEPSDKPCLTPLYIYYLLDPATQRKIQPILDSGYWILPFWGGYQPIMIMDFLRLCLDRYFYTGGVTFASLRAQSSSS